MIRVLSGNSMILVSNLTLELCGVANEGRGRVQLHYATQAILSLIQSMSKTHTFYAYTDCCDSLGYKLSPVEAVLLDMVLIGPMPVNPF